MTPDLKEKTILFIDWGNYIEVAMKLAEFYGTVYYYCDWQSAYPKYDAYVVGDGISTVLPNFIHTTSIWDVFDKVDLFYFPDLYNADLQVWLRERGYLVFGTGRGEDLELHREDTKKLLVELGLSVGSYESIIGLDALREHLKENTNLWVKTNIFRGSMESFKHTRYELSKPRLDRFEHVLGIFKDRQHFIVEEPIDDSIDFAADMITADGLYPAKTLAGVEQKNASYIGVITDYSRLPRAIKNINEKLAPVLKSYKYRCAFSPECRVTTKGKAYLLDPCCRHGHPPTSLQIEMIENYGELVWEVATGQQPVIRPKYKYGAQLIIKSEYSQREPQAIYFPESIRPFVKIKNLCIQDGVWYYIPAEHEMSEIGSVIGMGNSIRDAIKQCRENAKLVEGDGLTIDLDSLDKAKEEISELPKYGITIFDA